MAYTDNPSENKFKPGDLVFATVTPLQKLVVRRYVSRIYYCYLVDAPSSPELVYFERELTAVPG